MHIGAVHLNTANMDTMRAFYTDTIGLAVQSEDTNTLTLGVDDAPLLVLHHKPHGKQYHRTTGLYHFAILVPTRADLAAVLTHFLQQDTPLQGASDHIVSEALYLADPEGNGIEVYHDRPREAWYKNGEFQLATLPLDAQDLLAQTPPTAFTGLPSGTIIGHMHLHVSSIPNDTPFYTTLLGMDIMIGIGSANFLSYAGYHHHLGINTWSGKTPPPDDATGLHYWELVFDKSGNRDAVLKNLKAADIPIQQTPNGFLVHDHSQNAVLLRL